MEENNIDTTKTEATVIFEGIRDNLLKPMCKDIIFNTNAAKDGITTNLNQQDSKIQKYYTDINARIFRLSIFVIIIALLAIFNTVILSLLYFK